VTLTNMSDHDIDRIIKYHLSPINISFQTMNPELRCKMLNNRFAGDALKKVDKLFQAGITMNGQIVLCKGINDGKELEYSIQKLAEYLPYLESVSVVPVGLSKYREGLYALEPFSKKDAEDVINLIENWQKKIYPKFGLHFIHASDEWYILAERELPEEDRYDGYLQLENGVGMLRLQEEEFKDGLREIEDTRQLPDYSVKKEISAATGRLAYPYMKKMAEKMEELFPNVKIHVYEIVNDFFGERITVSGLLTGQDILRQLEGKDLGTELLLPQNVLRSGEEVFLDDYTKSELENALQVPIIIVKSSGYDWIHCVIE